MQNFGKIKNAFNNILVEGVVKKDMTKKNLFKQYLNAIKENKILKTQFLVYNNIEGKLESDHSNASTYVSENLKLLEKYSVKDITKANQKLIDLSKEVETKLNEAYEPALSALHESLANLIATKRTPNNIGDVSKHITNVIDYIKGNKAKEVNEKIDLPMSMISSIMVDKYNEKYESLDESDKKALKTIIDSNDEQKKEIYSTILRECIDLINEKLKTSNTETKEKLLMAKDKLLNDKQEVTENFTVNIAKLVELKSNLK